MRRIDTELHAALAAEAAAGARGRSHRTWHDPQRDGVQRFFVHMRPGTYVRPHCHAIESRIETTVLLTGSVELLLFDADGRLLDRLPMTPDGLQGVEIAPREWHGFVVHAPSTLFEVKQGPYDPTTDKRFADWAPPEGAAAVPAFRQWLAAARPGDRWPDQAESPPA